MPSILEFQEFFVEGRDPGKAHVLLHIAEPTAPHEKERGFLFAVVEITQGSPEQIREFQQLIDRVEQSFYARGEKREYLLERVLQNINRESQSILDYAGSEINCIVGSLHNGHLALAYHGNPSAHLLYAGAESMEEADIIGDQDKTNESRELFSEIIEGTINPGDYVYLATPHVADYFTVDRVRKLVESRSTRQSMEHVEKVLAGSGSDYSFGGILFHLTDSSDTPRTGAMPKSLESGSEESLNRLFTAAKTTEATLSPPILGDVSKNIKSIWGKRRHEGTTAETQTPTATAVAERAPRTETNHRYSDKRKAKEGLTGRILVTLGQGVIFLAQALIEAVRRSAIGTAHAVGFLVTLTTNRGNRRARALHELRLGMEKKRRFITGLPLLSKLILAAAVVLGLVFVASLGYMNVREARLQEERTYTETVAAIKDKKDAAEASLIYDQKSKASDLLNEAQALLATLPARTDEEKATAAELSEALAGVTEKLRNIKLLEPELIADLASASAGVRTERLVAVGNQIMAFGPNDSNLYIVNPATKQVETKSHDAVPELALALVPAEEDKVVFLTRDHKVAEYDPATGALVLKNISFPSSDVTITAAAIYNRRLYLADSTARQIYKHNPTQSGYDKGASWLTASSEAISGARGLTIDGDLYVLTGTEVKKYFTGVEQTFTVSGVDPALDQPAEIYTNGNLKDIIILEPKNKRLVIIDKTTGVFRAQYTALAWQKPESMWVEDGGKSIYVLDQNKIYKVRL